MATADEIAEFRLTIDERDTANYTDIQLSDRMDASTSLDTLASTIWLEKAARYTRLVDMQEGTSRRSLSQMYQHALLMSKTHAELADGAVAVARRTTTRAIERI